MTKLIPKKVEVFGAIFFLRSNSPTTGPNSMDRGFLDSAQSWEQTSVLFGSRVFRSVIIEFFRKKVTPFLMISSMFASHFFGLKCAARPPWGCFALFYSDISAMNHLRG